MKREEFKIGTIFICGSERWLCTDVGSRIVSAVCLTGMNDDWLVGPPYAVAEMIFDEHDQIACELVL